MQPAYCKRYYQVHVDCPLFSNVRTDYRLKSVYILIEYELSTL